MERDRISQLSDLANAVRYAQNGSKEQFSSYIDQLARIAN
jgi:hypothetical protein